MKPFSMILSFAMSFSVPIWAEEIKIDLSADPDLVNWVAPNRTVVPLNTTFQKICDKIEETKSRVTDAATIIGNPKDLAVETMLEPIPELFVYNSLSTTAPIGQMSPKENAARSIVLHFAVTAALRNIYEQTLSPKLARQRVSEIIDKNNCNGKLVEKVPLSMWRIRSSAQKTSIVLAPFKGNLSDEKVLSENDKFYQPQAYTKLIQEFGGQEGITDQVVAFARRNWNAGFEYRGDCAETVANSHRICSGQITLEDLLEQQSGRVDPKESWVWVIPIVVTAVGKVVSDYISENKKQETADRDAAKDARNEYWKREDQVREDIKEKDDQIKNQQQKIEDYKKEMQDSGQNRYPDPLGFSDLEELQKDLINLKYEKLFLEQDLDNIQSELVEIQKKWGFNYTPGVYHTGTMADLIDTIWMPFLTNLAASYHTCVDGVYSDISFYTAEQSRAGEKCSYEKVINALNLAAQPPAPIWYGDQGEQTKTPLEEKLEKAAQQSAPNCLSSYGADINNGCDEVMDLFYRGLGFEEGLAEYCAASGDCKKDTLYFENDGLKFGIPIKQ